jgi:hypothetical protein
MKHTRLIAMLLAAFMLLCAAPAFSQLEALRFDAAKVPVGRVFQFHKSQLDGTHDARISVYRPGGATHTPVCWSSTSCRSATSPATATCA